MSNNNDVTANSYKRCYVAFLDILGFTDFVNDPVCSWEKVNTVLSHIETEAVAGPHGMKQMYGVDIKDIKILCISDSVIISIEKSICNSFQTIIWLCGAFQLALLLNARLLMRGGISCGDFYQGSSERTGQPVLFGPAYNKAVELEKKAMYPRTIVDEIIKINLDQPSLLRKDDDGKIYVNYMYRAKKVGAFDVKMRSAARAIVERIRKYESDEHLQKKYTWTKDYITKSLEDDFIFSNENLKSCEEPKQRLNLCVKFADEEDDNGQT